MIDDITNKLAQDYSKLSPHVTDIVNRTRIAGLHKVAAQLRNKEDFELRDVIMELGTKLAYDFLKQQKIASGIQSLKELNSDGTVKLSGLLRIIKPEVLPGGAVRAGAAHDIGDKFVGRKVPRSVAEMPKSFSAQKEMEGTFHTYPSNWGSKEPPGINKMPKAPK